MSGEIYFDGERYLSARESARVANVTRDYIARLARSGKIKSRRVGKQWFVEDRSLREFLVEQGRAAEERKMELADDRKREYQASRFAAQIPDVENQEQLLDATVPVAGREPKEIPRVHTMYHAIAKHAPKHRLAAHVRAVPLYAAHPAFDLAHKAAAVIACLVLVLGAYAYANPEPFRVAFDAIRGVDVEQIASAGIDSADQVAAAESSGFFGAIVDFFGSLFDREQAEVRLTIEGYRPAAPAPQLPAQPVTQAPTQVINQPVIERVIETVRIVGTDALTGSQYTLLSGRIDELARLLDIRVDGIVRSFKNGGGGSSSGNFVGGSLEDLTISDSSWSGGTITGATITGGSVTASSLVGVVDVDNGGTGTSSAPTYGQLLVGDGLGGYALMATSSLGIAASGSTPGGVNGNVQYNDAGALGAEAAFSYDAAADRLTVPYASTTVLSAGTLCLGNDCQTSWPITGNNFDYLFPGNATTTQIAFNGGLTTNNATTTNLHITGLTNSLLATDGNGRVIATTTIGANLLDTSGNWTGLFDGQEGSFYLANAFSTTSAQYFVSVTDLFSTTSANFFAHSSTTIPKTYTANTFTSGQTFSDGATTTAFGITGLTNSLLATNADGSVYGTTTLSTSLLAGALGTINGTSFNRGDSITITAASSTLLADANTFTGSNTFTSLIAGSISGNAGTATALQTARTINGVSFDGTADIAITAASSTLLADTNNWSALQIFSIVAASSATTTNLAISSLPNSLLATNADGTVVATTTIGSNLINTSGDWTGTFDGLEGSAYLANSFSTTSASHFSSLGLAFSTTSTDYWKSVNNFFSTTSADYYTSVTNFFSTTSANHFVHSSTTIPKTYASNIFTNFNMFLASTTIGDGTQTGGLTVSGGATTTGNAYFAGNVGIGTQPSGHALDINGSVFFRTSGSGVSLVGNSDSLAMNFGGGIVTLSREDSTTGGLEIDRALYATTTGGNPALSFTGDIDTGLAAPGANVLTLMTGGLERMRIDSTGNIGIGTTTPYSNLSVWGSGSLFEAVTNASTTVFSIGQTGATTTNLAISTSLTFGGVSGTSWSDFCVSITGGSTLCDGSDNAGGGGGLATSTDIANTWIIYGTSAGDVGAESEFTYEDTTNLLTVANASTTNFTASYASSTSLFAGMLTLPTLGTSTGAFLAVDANGQVIATTTPTSGSSFAYPFPNNATTTLLAFNGGLFATNASTTNATTTNLHITSLTNALLATDANGRVVATTSITAASSTLLSDSNTFSGSNIFSSLLRMTSGLLATASSTIGNGTQTGGLTISGGATTTGDILGLGTLTINGNANLGGTLTATGGLTTLSNLLLTGSTTLQNFTFANATGTNATTTNFAITGLTHSLLSTNANGTVVATTSIGAGYITGSLGTINGTTFNRGDSITVSAASSTLLADSNTFSGNNIFSSLLRMTNGLLATASSTIGDGTQAGGLTISGGATTTGDAYFAATSTFASGILGPGSFVVQQGSGKVGIGTTVPTNFGTGVSLAINGGDTVINDNTPMLYLRANGGAGSADLRFNNDLVLTNGSAVELARLNASGNLGIGTTTPYAKLSVVGEAVAANFTATTTAVNTFPTLLSTNATTTNLGITGLTNALLATDANGRVFSTTTIGSNLINTSGNWTGTFDGQEGSFYLANSFSTTSASNFSSLGLAFSTTSTDYWKSVNNFFSTTSADYYVSVNNFFSTTSANYFAHSSTTIPKTYTDNAFTGNNTFTNATTTTFGITGLTNALLATDANGSVYATTSIRAASSTLLADSNTFSGSNIFSSLLRMTSGLLATASSTIGDGTQTGGLTISGGATTTGNAYFAGNVGIGTVAPAFDLEIDGTFDVNTGSAFIDLAGDTLWTFATNHTYYTSGANTLGLGFGTDQATRISGYDDGGTAYPVLLQPGGTGNGSGNVAIGTTTPYSKLSVWGTGSIFEAVNSASSTIFSVGQSGATTTNFAITNLTNSLLATRADGSVYATTTVGGNLINDTVNAFIHASTTVPKTYAANTFTNTNMFLASTTIGNGTQAGGLTISGGATTTGDTRLNGDFLAVPGAFQYFEIADGSGISALLPGYEFIAWGDNRTLLSMGAEADTMLQSYGPSYNVLLQPDFGNVGIGTTSPYAKLSVAGQVVASHFTATTTATSTFAGGIQTAALNVTSASASSTFSNGIQIAAGCFRLPDGSCATSNTGTVTGSGSSNRVAHWSGTSALTSTAGFTFDGTTLIAPEIQAASAGDPFFYVNRNDTGSADFQIGAFSTGESRISVDVGNSIANSALTFRVDNSERMRLTDAGRLGIGTTSPWGTLAVQGTAGQANPAFLVASSSPASEFFTVTSSGNVGIGDDAAATDARLRITTPSSFSGNALVVHESGVGSNGFIIGNSGNVIIQGVSGYTNTDLLTIVGRSSMAADYVNVIDSSANPIFLINPSGNVGVGTTSPYSKFSVWGGTTGNIFEAVTSASSSALAVSATGFGTTTVTGLNINGSATTTSNVGFNITSGCYAVNGTCISGGGGSGTVGSGTTGQFPYYAGNGTTLTATSSLFLAANGNIGIGSTTPSAKLSIEGPGNLTSALRVNDSLVSSAEFTSGTARAVFGSFADTFGFAGMDSNHPFYLQAAGNYRIGLSGTGGFAFGSTFYEEDAGLNNAIFEGRVGIGTTSPYAKLSVVGPVVAEYFNATSTSATSTFAGGLNVNNGSILHDFSTGLTSIDNLAIGAMEFDADSGIISWTDMPVTSSSATGTVNSYTASIDGNPALTIYSISTGGGNTASTSVGIGTTTPTTKFGGVLATAGPIFVGGPTTTATSTFEGNVQIMGTLKVGTSSTYITENGISSSVAQPFSITTSGTTSALSVSNTGFGTTTLKGLTISGFATSTSNVGFNITSGCYAINGTCISGGGGGSGTVGSGTTGQFPYYAGSGTTLTATSSLFLAANSKIGIGTTTPGAHLVVNGTTGQNIFQVATSTRQNIFTIDQNGQVHINGTANSILAGESHALTIHGDDSYTSGLLLVNTADARTPQIHFRNNSAGVTSSIYQGADYGLHFETENGPNALVITESGNVGVGTTSPFAKLSIHANSGETNHTLFSIASSTASATTSLFAISNTGTATFGQNGGSGNATFQVGNDTDAWAMGYNASDKSFRIASSTDLSSNVAMTISKTGLVISGDFNDTSDRRLKTDIADMATSSGLEAIRKLRPVTFEYSDPARRAGAQYGFIAQEVGEIFPTLVATTSPTELTPDGTVVLKYTGLIAPTILAVQELDRAFAAIASTTLVLDLSDEFASSSEATTTPKGYASSFFRNLFARTTQWLADAGNGITEIFAKTIRAENVYAETVHAQTLCLDGLCVTKDQLQQLLNGQVAGASTGGSSSPEPEEDDSATTTPPADEPEDEPATTTPPTSGGAETPPTEEEGGNEPVEEETLAEEPAEKEEEPADTEEESEPAPEPQPEPEPTPEPSAENSGE